LRLQSCWQIIRGRKCEGCWLLAISYWLYCWLFLTTAYFFTEKNFDACIVNEMHNHRD